MHFAIVEDDKLYQDKLLEYLRRFEKEQMGTNGGTEPFKISTFSDGKAIVDHYQPVYDVILMDIEMGEMDGMSAAEEIRRMDADVVIIFITNLAQYAIRGYQVEALDYVLKPISYYAFSQRIERAMQRMKRRQRAFLSISEGKGSITRLDLRDLKFVEVIGHAIIYHTTRGEIPSTGSISELEKTLDSKQFFRCNKGYLVNLDQVEKVDGNMALVGGEAVQISRARKKAFMDALNDYMSEVAK